MKAVVKTRDLRGSKPVRATEEIGFDINSCDAVARVGTLVANTYYVRELLRSGGMGDVYEVEHTRLGRRFAAKFLNRERCSDASCVERFQGEALALARVRSAHVVNIVDCGHDFDRVPFLIMDRLIGADLRSVLKNEGPLSVPRACKLVIDAAAGLSAIHAAGLVHGDNKPSNLFVSRDDFAVERCQVLDLGLWRALDTTGIAATGGAGTVRYMAPEQLTGNGRVDQRTDIYALGAVLYECLCGCPPHSDKCIERTIYAIIHARPRPLDDPTLPVPKRLEEIVLRALSPAAEARFESAAELITALAPFAPGARGAAMAARADPDESTSDVPTASMPTARKGRSTWVSFATVVGLCVIAALMGAAWGRAGSAGRSPASPAPSPRRASTDVPIAGSLPPTLARISPVAQHERPGKTEPLLGSVRAGAHFRRPPATPHGQPFRTPLLGNFDRKSPYDEPAR
jgi:serine/threonine-protein kinase